MAYSKRRDCHTFAQWAEQVGLIPCHCGGLVPDTGRGWSEVQIVLYSFSSVALVGVPGVHIPWIRVLLFAGEQLSRFPLLRKLLFPTDVLSFDGCVSDTLGTAVKIGTWWNSANTGSGHSWKDSWALVPHSEPQLESVALVWLLFSNHLDLSTPKFLGVCVACATRPLPNQDAPTFQELVPLFPVQSVSLPFPHGQRQLSSLCVCRGLITFFREISHPEAPTIGRGGKLTSLKGLLLADSQGAEGQQGQTALRDWKLDFPYGTDQYFLGQAEPIPDYLNKFHFGQYFQS